jgi:hypothetical protein
VDGEIASEIAYLRSEVSHLRSEVSHVRSEVSHLRGQVGKVASLGDRVVRLEESWHVVERVERKQDALQATVDRNQAQYERDRRVQNAYNELAVAQRQWTERFGRYGEARDLAASIIDAVGSAHISRAVIVDVTERLAVQTPRYWVAQATLAVAAWLDDNQRQHHEALDFALALDDGKASLFMALVLRDAGRDDVLQEWLDDYLSGLDPVNLPAHFQVVIDAVTGGALGGGSAPRLVRRMADWYSDAEGRQDIAADAVGEWKRRLLSLAGAAGHAGHAARHGQRDLSVLAASPAWQALNARNAANSAIEGAARHFRARFAAGADVSADVREHLAALLHDLAQTPDPAEEEYLRVIRENKAMTKAGGDLTAARALVAADEAGRAGTLNIVSMVSRAAFPTPADGRLPRPTVTELLAIMSSRRLIVIAADSLREELPPVGSVAVRVGGERPWDATFSCATEADRSRAGLHRQASEEARRICDQVAADAGRRQGRLRRLSNWVCPAALVAAAGLGSASFIAGLPPPDLILPAFGLAVPAIAGMSQIPKVVRRAAKKASQEQADVRDQLTTVAGQLADAWDQDRRGAGALPELRGFLRGLTAEHVHAATRPVTSPAPPRTREFPAWTPRPPRQRRALETAGSIRSSLERLRAGRCDDRVGGEAGDQPEEEADGQQVRAAGLGGDAEQLDHDVEDGPRGERQEDDAHRLAGVGVPDRGADERRAATDQAEQRQEAPAWPGRGIGTIPAAGQRRDDAEPFRRVVQAEPDDKQRGQRQLAGGRRLADREALGEVMQPDPGGDHQRQAPRRGPFRHPPGRRLRAGQRPRPEAALGRPRAVSRAHHPHLVGHQRPEPDRQAAGEQRPVAEDRRQAARMVVHLAQRGVDRLPRVRGDIPHQEQQDPDRQRVQDCPHRRRRAPHPPHGQAEHDRPARDEPQQQRLGQTHDRTALVVRQALPVQPRPGCPTPVVEVKDFFPCLTRPGILLRPPPASARVAGPLLAPG